jgi:hypothetical protein
MFPDLEVFRKALPIFPRGHYHLHLLSHGLNSVLLLFYMRGQTADDTQAVTQIQRENEQIVPLFAWVAVMIEWC